MKKNLGPFGRIIKSVQQDALQKREKEEREQAKEFERRKEFIRRISKLFTELEGDPAFIDWRERRRAWGGMNSIVLTSTSNESPDPDCCPDDWYLIYHFDHGVCVSRDPYREYRKDTTREDIENVVAKVHEDDWKQLESGFIRIKSVEMLTELLYKHQ